MARSKYNLFGSEVEFYLEADEIFSEPAINEAYPFALKLQKIFNIYDKDSEISLLNTDRNMVASPELLKVLNKALILCELSGGQYDVSLGKRFLQRKKGITLTDLSCSYRDIHISGEKVSFDHPDVWLDLGSIAKGYIADRIAKFFIEWGMESGYVDARGDLRVFGDAIEVDVKHPRLEGTICTVKIKDKGIATSGDYMQYSGDYSNSHILNQKDIISATVIADTLMDADAYATILMVCGPESREDIIKKSGFPAMIMDKNLNITYYNGFEDFISNDNVVD